MQTNGRYGCSQVWRPGFATGYYSSLQIAARKPLASCCALAILSAPVGRSQQTGRKLDGRTHELMQGPLNKETSKTVDGFTGARRPRPSQPRLPWRLPGWEFRQPRSTCIRAPLQVRHLLHSSTRRCLGVIPVEHFVSYPGLRRSIVRRLPVNSRRTPPLSLELCSNFLNEVALPVNIVDRGRIMSHVCDMTGPKRLLLSKELRVVDATG